MKIHKIVLPHREEIVFPYRLVDGKPLPNTRLQIEQFSAADAYLTPSEMANFLITHLNDGRFNDKRILNAQSIAEMHTQQYDHDYGLGFMIEKKNDKKLIWHSGGTAGFSTHFLLDPETKSGVYIAANATRVQKSLIVLAKQALKVSK
jgi:CubicO group peptidase (beta-lactamase class C family)